MLASDIYSVGVMLYQMLTGMLPYFSPNPAQIERLVAQGRCTPPKLRNNQIPREVSDIVMKAMAPELTDRYQRASELLEDLATAAEIDHKATAMEDIRRRLGPARPPSAASAGTAASRSTPARTAAPSAGRSSSRRRQAELAGRLVGRPYPAAPGGGGSAAREGARFGDGSHPRPDCLHLRSELGVLGTPQTRNAGPVNLKVSDTSAPSVDTRDPAARIAGYGFSSLGLHLDER